MNLAIGVLRYLAGTRELGLRFGGVGDIEMSGYSDSDWAGDPVTRRSTSGYIFTLNGAAVSWSSQLQRTVAASSVEAENQATAAAVREALWLRKLMVDLGSWTCNGFHKRIRFRNISRESSVNVTSDSATRFVSPPLARAFTFSNWIPGPCQFHIGLIVTLHVHTAGWSSPSQRPLATQMRLTTPSTIEMASGGSGKPSEVAAYASVDSFSFGASGSVLGNCGAASSSPGIPQKEVIFFDCSKPGPGRSGKGSGFPRQVAFVVKNMKARRLVAI